MEGQMDVGTRDTMTIALKAEGALVGREFLFNYFYINGLIGLERPALDCGNHSRIIGLDWNHRLYRIGMASTLQGHPRDD